MWVWVSISKAFIEYLGRHFQNFCINMGTNSQKFGINTSIHFGSWVACPYPKLVRVTPLKYVFSFISNCSLVSVLELFKKAEFKYLKLLNSLTLANFGVQG